MTKFTRRGRRAKAARAKASRRRFLAPLGVRYGGGVWYDPRTWDMWAKKAPAAEEEAPAAEEEAPAVSPEVAETPVETPDQTSPDGVQGGRRKRRSTRRRRTGRRSTRS